MTVFLPSLIPLAFVITRILGALLITSLRHRATFVRGIGIALIGVSLVTAVPIAAFCVWFVNSPM